MTEYITLKIPKDEFAMKDTDCICTCNGQFCPDEDDTDSCGWNLKQYVVKKPEFVPNNLRRGPARNRR